MRPPFRWSHLLPPSFWKSSFFFDWSPAFHINVGSHLRSLGPTQLFTHSHTYILSLITRDSFWAYHSFGLWESLTKREMRLMTVTPVPSSLHHHNYNSNHHHQSSRLNVCVCRHTQAPAVHFVVISEVGPIHNYSNMMVVKVAGWMVDTHLWATARETIWTRSRHSPPPPPGRTAKPKPATISTQEQLTLSKMIRNVLNHWTLNHHHTLHKR